MLLPRFLAPLLLAFAASAQSPAFVEKRVELRRELVGRLLGLATWSAEQKLYKERDDTWRLVIEIESDNLEARKGLRFARNPDGTWKEPAPRPAQNLNKPALESMPAKRAGAIAPYRDGLLRALDAESDASLIAPGVHAELLALDPNDRVVREKRGEVEDAGQWVLAETVRARAGRERLKRLVQEKLAEAVEVKDAAPTDVEKAWADAWTCGVGTERLRVLGAGGVGNCAELARKLDATVRFFGAFLGVPSEAPRDFTFYLAPGAARDAFLERNPAYSPELRAAMAKTPGAGVPGTTNTALFESEARRRDDCAVRNALWQLLRKHFGIDLPHGWAFEGLGLYLGRELVGSRLTWSVLARPDAEALRAGLLAPDSNWMNEASKLLAAPGAPALAVVLDKTVKELTVADMVVGYAFSAYLLEAHPERAAEFLRRTGAGQSADETSRAVLGWSMVELRDRLARWLTERR